MFLSRFLFSCALVWLMLPAAPPAMAQHEPKGAASSEQPDKALLDRALKELQKKRFQSARLLLQTLINTYDLSEYLPKAQLALAQSWFREGGARGFDQARFECEQLIGRFPESPEAKEANDLLEKMPRAK